jgi:sulfur relay protein TusB/DsrH
MLHILDHLPLQCTELERTTNGDTIILTANAIDAIKDTNPDHNLLKNLFKQFNLCVLYRDIEAKGVEISELISGITVLDDDEFNRCQEDNNCIRSWN